MDNSEEKVLEMDWNVNGNKLDIALKGRLDTMRAMTLDEKMNEIPKEVDTVTFDFKELNYIASAGLRILYWVQEYTEDKGGSMAVKNVSPEVMEILSITGFDELVSIE